MVDGIGMALNSLKSASDLAKALIELRDTAKIGEATIELQGKIAAAQQLALAAQQERAALITEVDELRRTIVQFENWETEKQRYGLTQVGSGAVVYRLKESMENGEPAHQICAHCYQNGEKSILQANTYYPGRSAVLECHRCGSVIYVGGVPQPEHEKMRPKPGGR